MQVIEQTHEEKVKMYMKAKKIQLVEMLIECNRILEAQNQAGEYLAQPYVSRQLPPMFIRWCISKKIEVYSGDAIGITSMDEGGMFPVVSAERLFEIFMEETGGNFR